MKDELIVTLKSTNHSVDIMDFITAINKTDSLSALVLPKLDDKNYYEINIYKLNS
ncbi:hypothetical protein [Paenibacillus sp. FSL H3-0333]|uniref:hypothetical protein n=1 Tax=Paenibacillus sp. FSL H3-0333 TaxID=2921373 RepID=UPI0030F589F1